MQRNDIPRIRLRNQRLVNNAAQETAETAAWFGAVQAQDYTSVMWALGLRCRAAGQANVEQAIVDGSIVRTWLLRGTLQFAAAADVRWMLDLLAPRLVAQSSRRRKQLQLDDAVLSCGYETLTQQLQGNQPVARSELLRAVENEGIDSQGARGYHILRGAALEGLICFGPVQGKEPTFVPLDAWVPARKHLDQDEAAAELARRYFFSHGPATLDDFVWWSGLTKSRAQAGLDMAKQQLHDEMIDGDTYWLAPISSNAELIPPIVDLLPAYDEYYLGYKNRTAVLDPAYDKKAVSNNGVFRPIILVDGQVVGIWKRTLKKSSVHISLTLFRSLNSGENEALHSAVQRYGDFLGLTASLA